MDGFLIHNFPMDRKNNRSRYRLKKPAMANNLYVVGQVRCFCSGYKMKKSHDSKQTSFGRIGDAALGRQGNKDQRNAMVIGLVVTEK